MKPVAPFQTNRKRPSLFPLAIAILAAAFAANCFAQSHPPQKNFIVILADDMGYGDIQPLGGSIPTPAINRMAQQGLLATDYYAPANLCTPSRAGLHTGR